MAETTNNQTVSVKVSAPFACFTRPEAKVERVSYLCMTPSAARGVLESILWKPEFQWVVRSITVLNPPKFISIRRNEIEDAINVDSTKKGRSRVLDWMSDPSTYEPYFADLQKVDPKSIPGTTGEREIPGNRVQRHTLALRDVAYVIAAEPQLTEKSNRPRTKPLYVDEPDSPNTVKKYMEMFARRVSKGQCFQQPFLGLREFVASFEPAKNVDIPDASDPMLGAKIYPLGRMFYDFDYRSDGSRVPLFAQGFLSNGVVDVDKMRAQATAEEANE